MSQYNGNPGPDPKRPLMMQRLRIGHEAPEIWNRLFPELKRNRECCDEVWFSTGVGFPKLEEHRRRSALMAEHAKELREIGIVPSLQFQATIGHGDFTTGAAGVEGKTWGSYVGIHGEQCRYVNCPRQPGFLDYMREVAKIYAQWHPGSVWIDDDLRLQGHSPASGPGGCCCPYCLSLFSQEEGRTYTREEIEAAYESDCELKRRWDAFGLRTLCLVAETIAASFREISPETRMALQHCGHRERLAIFDALKKASGHRSGSRPGGGAYSDHAPYTFLDKGIACSRQQNSQQGYDTLDQVCPEIESYPRVFTCKTPQGHRIESLFYLAMGMDSLSYFMMDPLYETPEWYGRELLAPLAAEAPCYREFIRHNEGTLPGGIGLNCPAAQPFLTVQELGLPLIGVPFGAYSPAAACHQITGKTAETLPVEQLAEALRGNVLLDGAAAAAICIRGLGELIGGIISRPIDQPPFDFYTDDPLNAGLESDRHFTWQGSRFVFDLPENVSVRILSRYKNSRLEDFGPAMVLLERPDGTRLAFIGNDGFNTQYLATARVLFLNRIAGWTAHGKLPVLPAEPVQCVLVPRISPEGVLRSVTVLNATIGKQKPFALRLRNVPDGIAEAEWLVPAEKPVKIPLERANGECRAVLPEIGPWDIGWLKIPVSSGN
ncbi:MAG: hypothetical protein J5806_00985 [Lentisphaeria bacterium]|nr:hypothetical protein [Lentisphaeria bacterium]